LRVTSRGLGDVYKRQVTGGGTPPVSGGLGAERRPVRGSQGAERSPWGVWGISPSKALIGRRPAFLLGEHEGAMPSRKRT
jgi:hypothetical protein